MTTMAMIRNEMVGSKPLDAQCPVANAKHTRRSRP